MKTTRILLLFAILFGCNQTFALTVDGVNYNLSSSDKTAEVARSSYYKGNIKIAQSVSDGVKSYTVTSIAPKAFYLCSITSVTIPESMTLIGEDAFDGCRSLESVILTDIAAWCHVELVSVTSNPLYFAKRLYVGESEVKNLVIPNSVGSIANSVFANCESLTSVTIPNSVTSIGGGAFASCINMTTLTLSNNLTTIGGSSFNRCSSLTSVVIPQGVTSIGGSAFSYCQGLISVTIPSSVTAIGYGAFTSCSAMTAVNITDLSAWCRIDVSEWNSNPLSFAHHLFLNGTEIKDMVLPAGVTTVGTRVFEGCSGLTSVTIPEGVTSISDNAFYNCSGMKSVSIPSSVTSIGNYAFEGCTGLAALNLTDLSAWCNIHFPSNKNNPLNFAHHIFMGGAEVKNLVIPNGVDSIGDYQFYGCSGVTSMNIPNSVKFIGHAAFTECSGLTSVDIPSSVTDVESYAFGGCTGLTSVTIPNSLTTIKYSVFRECSGLKSVVIPKSITSIESYAFYFCAGLEYVTIPGSVKYFGYNAFMNCSIKSVNVLDLVAWCKMDFIDLSGNPLAFSDSLCVNGVKVTDLVIPDGIDTIASYAFVGCRSIASVTIPSSVTYIGGYAFARDVYGVIYDLKAVYINDMEAWCRIKFHDGDSNPVNIANHLYLNGKEVKDLVIPSSITTINERAFLDCQSLVTVTIPSSVTEIQQYAFSWCTNITDIVSEMTTLPNNDEEIFHESVYRNAIVHVPAGKKDVYKANVFWGKFQNITEDPLAINPVTADQKNIEASCYDMQGREVQNPERGHIYIKDGKKILMK